MVLLCLQACNDEKEVDWTPDALTVSCNETLEEAGDGHWKVTLPTEYKGTVMVGAQSEIRDISAKVLIFLILSGLSTGISWLCYYRALQTGLASVIVPIDKLSILVTIAFSYSVFHEKLSLKSGTGLLLIVVGTLALLI